MVAESRSVFQQLLVAAAEQTEAVPVLSLIYGDFTLLTQTRWGEQILRFQVFLTCQDFDRGHHSWWKTPLWNPVFQTEHGKHKKIPLCIALISPVVFPPLVAV